MKEIKGISSARDYLIEMLPKQKTRLEENKLFDE
jgi:hypothetical protein